jgi:hypothetical protein
MISSTAMETLVRNFWLSSAAMSIGLDQLSAQLEQAKHVHRAGQIRPARQTTLMVFSLQSSGACARGFCVWPGVKYYRRPMSVRSHNWLDALNA